MRKEAGMMRKIQTMHVFQQGLIWGAMLGAVHLITSLISPFTTTSVFSSFIFSSLIATISIVFYVFIGLRASRVTGKTGTGALVGFLTGIVASIIGLVGTVISTFANMDELHQKLQEAANQLHLTGNASVTLLLALVLAVSIIGGLVISPGLGALAGAIGGAIGKRRAENEAIPEY
jgi:hypothetical protein